jgi:hypothetical protein
MIAASFLYPVVPRPVITGWDQLAAVLHVGSSLDIMLLLDLAATHLTHKSTELGASTATQSVWKWLTLADKAGLSTSCTRALVQRAVRVDRVSCKHTASLDGLSPVVLKQMVAALAVDERIPPTEGARCLKPCSCGMDYESYMMSHGPPPHKDHTLRWVCDACESAYRPGAVAKDNAY